MLEKLKTLIKTPKWLVAIGLGFFSIGLINTWGLGANSFAEMALWGKAAYVGFCIIIAIFIIRYFIGGFYHMIKSWIENAKRNK